MRPAAPTLLALPLLLTLAACATGSGRVALLDRLVGQPETELVRRMGVPSRTFETGGRRFLAYEEQHPAEIVGSGFYGGGFHGRYFGAGIGAGFGAFPAEIVPYRCETTFEVADQRVVTYALRGNACG